MAKRKPDLVEHRSEPCHYKAVHLELTPEQQEQVLRLVDATGNANVTGQLKFKADIDGATIAASTILAGAAV